ncbi:uncharacterized protein LOC117588023 isoform X2 [Drosophila guanche]|uniref:ZZ-type domain-containing protein n=2 Tax=Drosophila guanche TaxID=7266 RepID=A0A3B0JYI1_DROGU|nr:uncharacterized protein LOC117588023 isoform X2 [Drosophila guanche]SPP86123.1 Hypothetical predicted protein [Drosophila guanche]
MHRPGTHTSDSFGLNNALPERHVGFPCRQCQMVEYPGQRYTCFSCQDYHLCETCFTCNYRPASPNHKYYHIWKIFNTRTSIIPALSPSLKCALCQMQCVSIMWLYVHLLETHRDHADYKNYEREVYSFYVVDYASKNPGLPPPIDTVDIEGATILPAPAPFRDTQPAPRAGGLPTENRVPIIQLAISQASGSPEAAPRSVFNLQTASDTAINNRIDNATMEHVIRALQRVLNRMQDLDLNSASFEERRAGLLMRARALSNQFDTLQRNNSAQSSVTSSVQQMCRMIEHQAVGLQRLHQQLHGASTAPSLSNSNRSLGNVFDEVTAARRQQAVPPRGAPIRRAATMPPAPLEQAIPPPQESNGNSSYTYHDRELLSLRNRSRNLARRHNFLQMGRSQTLNQLSGSRLDFQAPLYRQAVVPPVMVGALKANNTTTEVTVQQTAKPKPIKTPKDKLELTDARFCCSKLKDAFEKMPGDTERERKVSKARFVDAIMCSMLSEKNLGLPQDLMPDMGSNQTPHKGPTTAEERLIPVSQNVTQTRETGTDAMTKFYKGLCDYSNWCGRLTQKIEAQKASKENEPKKVSQDPEGQATSTNLLLENILQMNSSGDYGQDGDILGAGINDQNPIAFIDSNDGNYDESIDEDSNDSKAGTDFANDDTNNGPANNNNIDANNSEYMAPSYHIEIFNTLNDNDAPEEINQQPAVAAVAVSAADVAERMAALMEHAESYYVHASDSEASDEEPDEFDDYLFDDDDDGFEMGY